MCELFLTLVVSIFKSLILRKVGEMIKNYLSHVCRILDDNDEILTTYQPEEGAIEIEAKSVLREHIGVVPIFQITYSQMTGLPSYEEGVFYIVKPIVVRAAKDLGRTIDDLYLPVFPVTDDEGMLIGFRGLASARDL